MKRTVPPLLLALMLLTLPLASPAWGQSVCEEINVKDIIRDARKPELQRVCRNVGLNEKITVSGLIAQYENDQQTTAFYTLKGNYGRTISVRTSSSKPEPNDRYSITGTISEGTVPGFTGKTLYISEENRQLILSETVSNRINNAENRAADAEIRLNETTAEFIKEKKEKDLFIYGLIGLIVLLFGATVAIVATRNRREPALSPGPSLPTAPEPVKVTETETVVMHHAPPGTLKVLPGRLIIKEGLNGIPELRFYKQSGQVETEITFGRESGQPYRHIQLKSATVSGKQAKLVFSNGQYTLINYASASSNPTTVNGTALGVNESALLNNGDVITMGEVILQYSAN